jgi:hypothetical protein
MQTTQYRKTGNISLFDREDNEAQLRKIGNPLERLSQVIDFETFRPTLKEEMLNHDKKSNAGSKPKFHVKETKMQKTK